MKEREDYNELGWRLREKELQSDYRDMFIIALALICALGFLIFTIDWGSL